MSDKKIKGKIHFSGFTLDTDSHVLTRHGSEKRLEPKVVALLCYLVENLNQVVSREQIADSVWPGVVVGDDAINRTIFALRNALADDAKRPQFIETIPKKGYRFFAELELVKDDKPALPWIWLGAVLLLVLLGIGFWASQKPTVPPSSIGIGVVQAYTRHVGVESGLAINSSAQKLLYVHSHKGEPTLYLADMRTDKREKIALAGSSLSSPIWIDDYSFVILRFIDDEYQLVKHTAQNSEEVLYRSLHKLSDLVYLPGREPLIVLAERESYRRTLLKSVNLINGRSNAFLQGVKGLPSRLYHPLFSPDLKYLYVAALDGWQPEIFKIELVTSKAQSLSREFDRIRGLSWGPDEQLLISGVKDITEGLWLLAPEIGARPHSLFRATAGEQVRGAEWDPQTNTMYFENFITNTNVLEYTRSTQSFNALQALNSEGAEKSSRYSQDGRYIFYCSDRSGFFDVWRYDLHEQQNQRISNMNSLACGQLLLSHDENKAALLTRRGQLELTILDVKTGDILSSMPLDDLLVPVAWSQDDTGIYASTHYTTNRKLYRFEALSLTEQQYWIGASLFAEEDVNAEYLYYLSDDDLVKENLISGEQEIVIEALEDLDLMYPPQIKLLGESLYLSYLDEDALASVEYPFGSTNDRVRHVIPLPGLTPDKFMLDGMNKTLEHFLFRERKSSQGNIIKVELQ